MGRSRRVTLQCAAEDLSSGWTTPADFDNVRELRVLAQKAVAGDTTDSAISRHLRLLPPLALLRHPLVHAFDEQFAGDDDRGTLRETISAVNDHQWFKQTYSARWRGAAVIIEKAGVKTAWLGAAGYHRAGSPEDFYTEFARRCRGGSDGFLPQAEDFKVEAVEDKISRRDAWKLQLHLTALVLLNTALNDPENSYDVIVLSPSGRELLTLAMMVVHTDVDGTVAHELVVEIVPADWESPRLCEQASIIVKSAIDPQFETWTTAPLQDNAVSHWTVLTEDTITSARAVAESGEVGPDARPGEVRLGTIAHYARRDNIAYASVHGEAVQAMCGHWFVPTADHEHKPRCATCREEFERIPVKPK
ncbi:MULTISPECIES: DUF3039 domain-containing protein [Microbacterium]|uniref:DUF3039 domain-containing protein n=1 Tax=Microbacterium TaxID=33882 RepID=UPI002788737E|nr:MULTISPECIES: DUF3039 domain-containing protein [Microbacterium]MDQ1074807.1 hypothetical protein [Microbacterium sp. SORGH_AS_0969]MDQ1115032.1 hypothetical protein [Microbacterium testaceum]